MGPLFPSQALETRSLNHWTNRKVPISPFYGQDTEAHRGDLHKVTQLGVAESRVRLQADVADPVILVPAAYCLSTKKRAQGSRLLMCNGLALTQESSSG